MSLYFFFISLSKLYPNLFSQTEKQETFFFFSVGKTCFSDGGKNKELKKIISAKLVFFSFFFKKIWSWVINSGEKTVRIRLQNMDNWIFKMYFILFFFLLFTCLWGFSDSDFQIQIFRFRFSDSDFSVQICHSCSQVVLLLQIKFVCVYSCLVLHFCITCWNNRLMSGSLAQTYVNCTVSCMHRMLIAYSDGYHTLYEAEKHIPWWKMSARVESLCFTWQTLKCSELLVQLSLSRCLTSLCWKTNIILVISQF